MVLLYQSSEIPVTLKSGRNALLGSDTVLKLTHLSLHSTSSQTLWRLPVTEIHFADVVKYVQDIPTTSSGTLTTNFIHRAATECSWAFWCTRTVKTMYIDNNSHIALWSTMIQGQQSLMLRWRSFSIWGREDVAFSSSYKCSKFFVYDSLQPVAPRITHDPRPAIVDSHFQDQARGYRNPFFL